MLPSFLINQQIEKIRNVIIVIDYRLLTWQPVTSEFVWVVAILTLPFTFAIIGLSLPAVPLTNIYVGTRVEEL